MDEFDIIEKFFKPLSCPSADVLLGIGDDAACVKVPPDQALFVSTDTLVVGVHFHQDWDPYDIAYKAVMVNLSDMAAMAAKPRWLSLALTLPQAETIWLRQFARGLQEALTQYKLTLIGGDTTRAPQLTITMTIHGTALPQTAVRRQGAKPEDQIYVTGPLGAAALAINLIENQKKIGAEEHALLWKFLQHPQPRLGFTPLLSAVASAAIDISDGLGADLNHICSQSGVGAILAHEKIPVHPLVIKYHANPLLFALGGGDDYELCFTVAPEKELLLQQMLRTYSLIAYPVGKIEAEQGLRICYPSGQVKSLSPLGYQHFK